MDLFDITTGFHALNGPRESTVQERDAYLGWLAQQRGVSIPRNAEFQWAGIWDATAKVMALDMPGYGPQPAATMEVLDAAGNVLRCTPLALNGRGQLVMTAKQIAEATGLKPVRKKAAKAAPIAAAAPVANTVAETPATVAEQVEAWTASIVDAPEPVEAAPVASDGLAATVAALLQRVASLETQEAARVAVMHAAMGVQASPDRHTVNRAARERMVRAYLRMRADRAAVRAELAERNASYERGMAQYAERGAELTAARAENELLVQERDKARGTLWHAQNALQGAGRRAERLARVAVDQRRSMARLKQDIAGARAETRAMARRADEARARYAVANPSPTPPPPTDTVMARAFAGAR